MCRAAALKSENKQRPSATSESGNRGTATFRYTYGTKQNFVNLNPQRNTEKGSNQRRGDQAKCSKFHTNEYLWDGS